MLFSYWVSDEPHTGLTLDEDDILPSNEDYTTILAHFAVLAGRVIQKHLPALKDFPDLVLQHIHHSHYKEMKQRSQVVRFKNYFLCFITVLQSTHKGALGDHHEK